MALFATFVGVVVSGGLFGGISSCFIALLGGGIGELFLFIPIGMIFGAFIAGIVLIPIGLVVLCVSLVFDSISAGWTLRRLRWYGGICGFLVGSLSFSMLTGVGLELIAGLVPGVFGCLGTLWIASRIVRARMRQPLSSELADEDPVPATPLPTDPNST